MPHPRVRLAPTDADIPGDALHDLEARFAAVRAELRLTLDYPADAAARRDDAVNRRDSFSGVNIDEELADMVVFQNSYGAAARTITVAREMYDTLIAMMR